MLEVGRSYLKSELSTIFGTRSKQGLERKMDRYGIEYAASGRGECAVYEIQKISDPFKLFAITELGFDANTDFRKLRTFYWYFFNDEIFMAMPDEVKECMLRFEDKTLSRQTIAKYTQKLVDKNMINRNSDNFIYYFAHKGQQRFVERSEYSRAWKDYWEDKKNGVDYYEAIYRMKKKYGGVARKQAIPQINGIYNADIERMCSLIQESLENEV